MGLDLRNGQLADMRAACVLEPADVKRGLVRLASEVGDGSLVVVAVVD
jgi:hypothetical protein